MSLRVTNANIHAPSSEREKDSSDAEAQFAQADRDLHAAENKKGSLQQKLDADKARLKGNTNTLIQLIHSHRLAVVQSKVTDALQYETDDGRHFDRVADCIEDAQNGLTDAQM